MKRPANILWIVSDHQVHATRPTALRLPPLQQKLAQCGVTFTQAKSVLPVCSPARASMLNGLYPHAHGLTENDGRFGGRSGLDPKDWMIHQPFINAGYQCAWFGKWHVDNNRSAQEYGFEGFSLPGYGYPYDQDIYREYLSRQKIQEPVVEIEIPGESGIPCGTEIALCDQATWFDFEAGVAKLKGSVEAHEAFFVTNLASRWLKKVNNKPFFVRIDTWGPHPPYVVGDPFIDAIASNEVQLPQNFYSNLKKRPKHHSDYRDYWHDTLNLDGSSWHLMYRRALEHGNLIESALCGLLSQIDLDNTLVIFNSDHGDAVGSNGAVANKGGLMVEATMQIPLQMAGIGLPRGVRCDELVSNLDLVPTIFSLCESAKEKTFHGVNLFPLARQTAQNQRKGLLTQHYGLHQPVVQRAWYENQWKLVVQPDGFKELYDLSADPNEINNLVQVEEFKERCNTMYDHLLKKMSELNDPAISLYQ